MNDFAESRNKKASEGWRVLMLSIADPGLPGSGASTATRGILKLFANSGLTARIDCLPLGIATPERRRLRQAASLASAMLFSLPAKLAFTHSRAGCFEIRKLIRTRDFDLVVLNGSDLLWALNELPEDIPRLLVAHNVEHLLYASQIRSLRWKPWPGQKLLESDCERLRDYEIEGWRRTGSVIFLSGNDAAYAGGECPGLRSLVVPPLFDYAGAERPARAADGLLRLGFLGNLAWWPNRQGLRWFLGEVFDHTPDNVRLHLFGAEDYLIPDHPRIVKRGFVHDVAEAWPECDLMICPVFSGGGACVKLAEAVYNGMPVLARSFAAKGLPSLYDPAVVLLDSAEEWIELLRSSRVLDLAGARVSRRVSAQFSEPAHREPFCRFLRRVMAEPRSAFRGAGRPQGPLKERAAASPRHAGIDRVRSGDPLAVAGSEGVS